MNYEEHNVESIDSLISELLELDRSDVWLYRGQRRSEWLLGLHDLPSESLLRSRLIQFKKRCMEFKKPDYTSEEDHWRWLFYAQHHRLITRLLDWTTNPLVAMYFAVENIISRCSDKEHFGAVWALHVDPERFRTPDQIGGPPDILKDWTIVNPPPVTHRLVRQSGKFSYHPEGAAQVITGSVLRPAEKLRKYTLKGDGGMNPAKEVRRRLCTMNIHHAFLFPGPDGVAQFINNEWPLVVPDD